MLWIVLSVLHALNPRDCYTNLPKTVQRCVGDDLTIDPAFVGYPSTPVLDWTNIAGDGRHTVLQNGTLTIRNVQESDTELYSYLVHSEDAFTLSFFNLTVRDCSVATTRGVATATPVTTRPVVVTATPSRGATFLSSATPTDTARRRVVTTGSPTWLKSTSLGQQDTAVRSWHLTSSLDRTVSQRTWATSVHQPTKSVDPYSGDLLELVVDDVRVCYGQNATIDVKLLDSRSDFPYRGTYTVTWSSTVQYNVLRRTLRNELSLINAKESGYITIIIDKVQKSQTIKILVLDKDDIDCEGPAVDTSVPVSSSLSELTSATRLHVPSTIESLSFSTSYPSDSTASTTQIRRVSKSDVIASSRPSEAKPSTGRDTIVTTRGPDPVTGAREASSSASTTGPVVYTSSVSASASSSAYVPNVYLQFTVRPDDVETFAGLTIRLDCAASGKPTPVNIFWLFGNQLLTSNSDTELHSNGSLTLHNVRTLSSGVYSCVAENGYMTIMSVAEINVQIPKFVGVDSSGNLHIKDSIDGICLSVPSTQKFKALTAFPGSGQIYAVDFNGKLWTAESFLGPFERDASLRAGLSLQGVVIGPGGTLYAVDKSGFIWLKTEAGSWKKSKLTSQFRSIAFYSTGELLAVQKKYQLKQKTTTDLMSAWLPAIECPYKLNAVTLYDDTILGITTSRELVFLENDLWRRAEYSCDLVSITPINITAIPTSAPQITDFSGDEYVIPSGGSITLTCTVFGIPTPTTVIQAHPAVAVYSPQNTIASVVSTVEVLTNVTETQHYQCYTINPSGVDSHLVHVIVYEPLAFNETMPPATVIYTEEESEFVCVPNVEDEISVSWYINGRLIDHAQNLTIVTLDVSHNDHVRCEVTSSYDTIAADTNVTVVGLPMVGIIDGALYLCVDEAWVKVEEEAEELELDYITSAEDGSILGIESGTEQLMYRASLGSNWTSLDMCCYQAVAFVDSRTSASFGLSGNGYLLLQDSSISMVTGSDVITLPNTPGDVKSLAAHGSVVLAVTREMVMFSFTAAADGWVEVPLPFSPLVIQYSPPTNQWMSIANSSRDIYMSEYIIGDVTDVEAWYRAEGCAGSDGALPVPIYGKDRKPTILSLTGNETEVVGVEYMLICVVDAYPPPLVTIKHIGRTGKETVVSQEFKEKIISVSTHDIDALRLSDEGVFVCAAENRNGNTEQSTALVVGVAPEFELKPKSAVTSEPQQISLVCMATGTPTPDITWYFNGVEIGSSSHYTNQPRYLLTFLLTEERAGTYSCVASNMFGIVTSEAKTSIEDAVIIGIEEDNLYRQPLNGSCQVVDSSSLYLDVAEVPITMERNHLVSNSKVVMVGLDNELYRASDLTAAPVHVHGSCCVKKISLVGNKVYGITPTNWLVSWNDYSLNWDVHMFGEHVEQIESKDGVLYVSTDGINYKRCDLDGVCSAVSDQDISVEREVKVDADNRVVRYNTNTRDWEQVSPADSSSKMKSIATSPSGKIYAVGKDGYLYVRSSLANQWHKTLDKHSGFTAVEVDCESKMWLLKKGKLFSVEGEDLKKHPSSLKLTDFSTYKAGFVGISVEGDLVISESTVTLDWQVVEAAGDLLSVDSYRHHGLLGVYPDGLKIKQDLGSAWEKYSDDCGLRDATELVSASYCNATAPLTKMELVKDPAVDEEGNLLYPYTPSPSSSVPVNTDIMLVCQVAYFGHSPSVYLTYQGVIIPTTQTSQNTSTITATYYIASVMFEDEGSFACYADDGDFVTRDVIRLTVYDNLRLSTSPTSQTTYLGGNIVLRCSATSFSHVQYTWVKVEDSGSEEVVNGGDLHVSIQAGDVFIYDIQAFHEASYYCNVSNSRDTVSSDLVSLSIIVPQYLATFADSKTYVSSDLDNFYPVFITTGVLDTAVYNQVLYLVLSDYSVYTYPLTGRQEHLTLLPNSCCVNSIAVYSEFGSVRLVASQVEPSFDLLHRRIDGNAWIANSASITYVSVVSDEIIARERYTGYSIVKAGIDATWSSTSTRLDVLHVCGYHSSMIIAVGHDRRLYSAPDYTDSWVLIPHFANIETATIDNDAQYIYTVFTTGEIRRYPLSDLETEAAPSEGEMVFNPKFKVLHVSWRGTIYYGDKYNRLMVSRSFTSYPVPHSGIVYGLAVVTLTDKSILVLNKKGIHNVTDTSSTLIRALDDMTSMSLQNDMLVLTDEGPGLFSLTLDNIRHGALIQLDSISLERVFSVPQIMGLSRDDDVIKTRTDQGWEDLEGSGVQYLAHIAVLRINSRTSTITTETHTYYVELGDEIRITCEAIGTPTNTQTITPRTDDMMAPSYREYFRREDIAAMEVSPVTSIIKITAEENMNEWYRCTATNMYGTDYQDFKVVIWRPIEFIEEPEDTVIDEGTAHVLLCAATALPAPSITWYKEGVQVTATEQILPLQTGGLLLSPAAVSHAGVYTCQAANSREIATTSATMFVKRPLNFTATPSDITLKAGEEATLSCRATGYPEPTVTWTNGEGDVVPEPGSRNVVQLSDGSLVITATDASLSGTYHCTASNVYENITESAVVVIKEPEMPIITSGPTDRTVFIGTTVEVSCTATGDPLPQLYILKSGIPQQAAVTIQDDTVTARVTLHISNLTSSGLYICNAINSKGSDSASGVITVFDEVSVQMAYASGDNSTIPVSGPATDKVTLAGHTLLPSSQIEMVCDVAGAPVPTVSWSLYNTVLEASAKYEMRAIDATSHTLTVTRFSAQDAGYYSCSATNHLSSDTQTVVVNVETPIGYENWTSCDVECGYGVQYRQALCSNQLNEDIVPCQDTSGMQSKVCKMPDCPEKPQIESFGPSSETISRGSSLLFSCEVSGSPPIRLVWRKEEEQLQTDSRMSIFSQGNVYMLKITDLAVSDSGDYSCTAYNYEGEDSETMEIEVILTWSEWSRWTSCTAECDGGRRRRERLCENEDRSLCSGEEAQTEQCNTFDCERSSPIIIIPVEDATAAVGTCVTFTCQIGSVPAPDVTWWSGEGMLNPIKNTNAKILLDNGYSTLVLCNLTLDDMECYNCLGVNSEGVNMSTGMLKVVAPPQITTWPQDQRAVEGAFVELTCETTGMPLPEVQWLLDGETFAHKLVLQSSSSLRLTNISAAQQGTYSCVAQNSAGTTFAEAVISVTAVNGNWGAWTDWSACSEECGYGDQERRRHCNNPAPSQSGTPCPGPGTQAQECFLQECESEAEWSDWSEWSECMPSCGLGNHTRVRTCLSGTDCVGESFETSLCYTRPCPVDGGYSSWSRWSSCSVDCGGGNQTRTRTCTEPRPAHGGQPCSQDVGYDIRQCHSQSCPVSPSIVISPEDKTSGRGAAVTFICAAEGFPTPTITWFEEDLSMNAMTTTSGQRITSYLVIKQADQDRSFNCLAQNEAGAALSSAELLVTKKLPEFTLFPADTQIREDRDLLLDCLVDQDSEIMWLFNNQPVAEYFSGALTLANGTLLIQDATRFHTGRYDCIATNDIGTADRSAYVTISAVHGQYSEWGAWSNCSVSCGEGVQTRERECNNPTPSSNGLVCSGKPVDSVSCLYEDCDEAAQYGPWSECSEVCGGGIKTRIVKCSDPDCPRVDMETCNTHHCPVDGNYTAWSDWSTCSVACGGGLMTRMRTCKNPRPAYGGSPCPGPQKEVDMESCNLQSCPRATQLIGAPSSTTVPLGDDVTLTASYLGSPRPAIAWLANGETIFNTSRVSVETTELDGMYMSTLSIRNVQISDEKTYSVILTSSNKKPILSTASITTTLVPEILGTVPSVIVDEGQSITLDCEVNSRPSSMVSWTPLSGQATFLPNNTLHIPDVKISEAGMYTCTAINSVGRDSKIVLVTVRAINGGMSDWSAWTACSVECGSGTKTKTRRCSDPEPSYSGRNCTGALTKTMECTYKACPVNGGYTDWSTWTQCSTSCGLGERTRERTCTSPAPQHGGKPCYAGERVLTRDACFEANCPIDGGWSDWNSWSQCSVSCGGGVQSRSRSCANPTPMFEGARCGPQDPQVESRGCNEQLSCPEHPIVFSIANQEATVGDTVEFACRIHAYPRPSVLWMRDSVQVVDTNNTVITSKSLDKTTLISKLVLYDVTAEEAGMYVCLATNEAGSNIENAALVVYDPDRDVSVTDVALREGDTVTLACVSTGPVTWDLDDVPLSPGSRFLFLEKNLVISDSTVYISGVYTCSEDEGNINRKRYDVKITAIDGGVSDWAVWSACVGVGCGTGQTSRRRQCTNPPPSPNGADCRETLTDTRPCTVPCISEWSDWTPWTECTAECDGGYQSRTKICITQGNNQTCSGAGSDIRPCNTKECEVNGAWSGWSGWSGCSVSCGSGIKTKTRECDDPAPAAGGRYCPGNSEEAVLCTGPVCPTDGEWGVWDSWTSCSVNCGTGIKTRGRNCDSPGPRDGGDECPGSDIQVRECSRPACTEEGEFTNWTDWSECSVECGDGTKTRARECVAKRRKKSDTPVADVTCQGETSQIQVCSKRCAEIVYAPESVDANVGETAQFDCTGLEGQITWLKSGRIIEDRGRIELFSRGYISRLQISQVTRQDEALYTCLVTVGNFTSRASAQLTVFEPALITYVTEEQHVREGESVTLECVARGVPAPTVRITKYESLDMVVMDMAPPNTYEVKETLKINYVRASDAGEYVCTARNDRAVDERSLVVILVVDGGWSDWSTYSACSATCGRGTKSRTRECSAPAPQNGGSYCLDSDVEAMSCSESACDYGPIFTQTPANERVTAGDRVVISVAVDAKPTAEVFWLTPGGPADMLMGFQVNSDNLTLVITEATVRDSGVYKVLARNGAGVAEFAFTVIVEGKSPMFVSKLQNLTVTTGTALQMTVTAAGNPLPRVEFFRTIDGAAVKLAAQTLSQSSSLIGSRFSVAVISQADQGEYYAIANSEYGSDITRGFLSVVQDTVAAQVSILISSPLRVLYGDPALIPVEVIGVPAPAVTWRTPNTNTEFVVHSNGSMDLVSVMPQDEGYYTVTVNNTGSQDTETIQIIIVGRRPEIIRSRTTSDQDIIRNSDFSIETQAAGVPLPSLALTGPNGENIPFNLQLIENTDIVEGRAVLDTSRLENSGQYRILARNKHGSAEVRVQLQILSDTSAPEFNSTIYSLQLFHGQSGSVPIGTRGNPDPTISIQPQSDRVAVEGDSVVFSQVNSETEGIYTITATNDEGEDRAVIVLEVVGHPPRFVGTFANLTLPHLTPHTVRVSAVGLPAPDIAVSRLTGDLEIFYRPEVIVSGSTSTAIVQLDNPTVSDSGWYVVSANNEYGVNTTSAYLTFTTVSEEPKFVYGIQDTIVDQGASHEVYFVVSGIPEPRIVLTKDNVNISFYSLPADNGVKYVHDIDEMSPEEAGTYSAVARNEMGSASSTATITIKLAHRAPEFKETPADVALNSGSSYTISGVVTGVPRPNVYVTDEDGRVVGQGELVVVDEETVRFTLAISQIGEEDRGYYTMTANNGFGEPASHTFLLDLLPEPTSSPPFSSSTSAILDKGDYTTTVITITKPLPSEVYLSKGEDLQLSIRASGKPSYEEFLTITLGHRNRPEHLLQDLTSYLAYNITHDAGSDTDFTAQLTLPYPYSLQPGQIVLRISNAVGGDETSTNLNVEEAGREAAPYFDPAPVSVKSYADSPVLLKTRVRGSLPLQVDWFFTTPGGVPRPVSGNQYQAHVNGSLAISALSRDEVGTYLVQVSNSAGSATETVEVQLADSAGYTDWTDWSACSAECEGRRTRRRTCTNPPPAPGYPDCQYGSIQTAVEKCGAAVCPGFSDWSSWEDCSKDCGYGTRERRRECDNPAPAAGGPDCQGLALDTMACYLGRCPDRVNGAWTEWSRYSDCSVPCGTGTARRTRTCTNPRPSAGGATCEGSGHQQQSCVIKPVCNRLARWESWSVWDECSAACGGGTQQRTRSCQDNACSGNEAQVRDCNTNDCALRRAKHRSAQVLVAPQRASPATTKVPFQLDMGRTSVCLSVKLEPDVSYTLLETDSTQIYGVLLKTGGYSSITLYSGNDGSLTLTPDLSAPLPASLGSVSVKQKQGRVILTSEQFKLVVKLGDEPDTLTTDLTELRDEAEGLLEILHSLSKSASIQNKSENRKILRHKNTGYLLKVSKSRDCYALSNNKYSEHILPGSVVSEYIAEGV